MSDRYVKAGSRLISTLCPSALSLAFVSLFLLYLILLAACAAPPPQAALPASSAEAAVGMDELRRRVETAISSRDYGAMEALMGDEFRIEFGSGVFPLEPAAAIGQIRNIHLIAGPARFVEPEAPLQELLDLERYEAFWAEAEGVELILSEGWGSSGDGEGLLVLARDENGEPYWYGLLIRPLGFPRLF